MFIVTDLVSISERRFVLGHCFVMFFLVIVCCALSKCAISLLREREIVERERQTEREREGERELVALF